jgi:hypothetical protein
MPKMTKMTFSIGPKFLKMLKITKITKNDFLTPFLTPFSDLQNIALIYFFSFLVLLEDSYSSKPK